MPIRRKPDSPTFIIKPFHNKDTANGVSDHQREEQLPFIFGVIGKPSLRHAPTRETT